MGELLRSACERILSKNTMSNIDTKILLKDGDGLNEKASCFLEPREQMLL